MIFKSRASTNMRQMTKYSLREIIFSQTLSLLEVDIFQTLISVTRKTQSITKMAKILKKRIYSGDLLQV